MLSSRLRRAALLPLLALLVAPVPPGSAPDDSPWAAPPLERAISIRDGRSGEVRSLDQLLDSLTRADVVFLGETHDDETTHRVEQAIFEGLLERRSGKVVLALEMFERDVQDDLDAYLHGSIDETTFLERARPWRNYRTAYRGLIETARKAGAPVMASNFPRPLLRRMRMEGEAVLDALEGSEARQAPRELHPNTPAYWERVDNAIRGHVGMTPSADDDRLTSTQSLWDNTMGETCADALDTHPGHLVLHVNGSFHSNYWDGTVHQLKTRKPDARVLTIAVQPTSHPAVADPSGPPVADWVVFAESRASDVRDGKWSVSVSRPVDYRFHLPKSASPEKPVPLLIWLSDDGFTAGDGLDLWKNRLGDEAAIVVLEPLHRSVAPDLGNGGYWFWGDSFAADLGTMTVAIERAWAYLSRHQPLDPRRVCLAG
ncbi:MAG: ChaN family lipoprotein, partial [Acidobacteriota bacterium]